MSGISFATLRARLQASTFAKVLFWDVLSKCSDFLLLPIYLAIFSPEEYGFYSYAIFVVISIASVLKLGLDTAMSKLYYEEDKYARDQMLYTLNLTWLVVFGVLSAFAIFAGLDSWFYQRVLSITPDQYTQLRYPLLAFVLFYLVQGTLNVYYVISGQAIVFQKLNLLRIVVGNILIIALLYFVSVENKAYLRLTYEPVIYLVLFLPLLYNYIKRLSANFNPAIFSVSLPIALPMLGTILVGLVYSLSDKYYLQKTNNYDTLAIYNLATVLCAPATMFFSSFQTVWFPQFSQEKSNTIRFEKSSTFIKQLLMLFAVLLVVLMIGLGIALKMHLIKPHYVLVLSILPFVYTAKVFDVLAQVYNNFVVVWGKTYFNLVLSLVFAFLVFGLNYYLIPKFGLMAAAGILLFTALAKYYIYYLFIKSHLKSVTN
jgi:O-antigen/teichoic acid export membrane protein